MLVPQGQGPLAKSQPRWTGLRSRVSGGRRRLGGAGRVQRRGLILGVRADGLVVGLVVTAALGLLAAGVALAEGPNQNHIVGPGDTVYRIARAYRVSPQAIVEANRLADPDRLRPGDELIVPLSSTLAAPRDVTSDAGSVTSDQEKPTADITRHPSLVTRHVVVAGENLIGIARQYGVTVDEIVAANDLPDRQRIRAGQELAIPKHEPERPRPLDRAGARPASPDAGERPEQDPGHEFLITYYCLPGTMANSRAVRSGVAASDRSVVPLGSVVEVEGLGIFSIEDQFAVDLGEYRLDIWVPTCAEARQRGVDRRQGWIISRP